MLKLLTLGVVAFVVSLVITAPAQVVSRYLPPAIKTTGLQGTLWEGRASRLQVRGFDLGEVTWDAQPLALLVGRLQSAVSIDQPDLLGQGTVGFGFNSIRFTDTHLTGSSRLVTPYLSDYGINVDGSFEVNARALQFGDHGPQAADGVVTWRDARVLSPAELVLGDVNVSLKQEGDAAIADLSNTGDELRLSGEARLGPGWKYDARLRVEPTASTPKKIRDTLPLLGQPDARGAVTLSQQGTLEPSTAHAGSERQSPAKARRR